LPDLIVQRHARHHVLVPVVLLSVVGMESSRVPYPPASSVFWWVMFASAATAGVAYWWTCRRSYLIAFWALMVTSLAMRGAAYVVYQDGLRAPAALAGLVIYFSVGWLSAEVHRGGANA
jgi:hypothetical protein